MKKNKFTRRWFFVFTTVAVVFFASLLILNIIVSNMMHHKIKSICKSSFNCDIKLEKPHVSIVRGIVIFDNRSVDRHIDGRKFNVNVDRMFIKINMASAIKNILYYSNSTTKFFANIDFGHKKRIRVNLTGNIDINSSKGDFSLEIKCSNVDIADIAQHHVAPIYVKEGTADISLIGTCEGGRLDFSQHILINDLFLNIKKEQDSDREIFIGLTYRDILDYVRAKKGKVDINFNIIGTLKEPELDLRPMIENILVEIMTLKIS